MFFDEVEQEKNLWIGTQCIEYFLTLRKRALHNILFNLRVILRVRKIALSRDRRKAVSYNEI